MFGFSLLLRHFCWRRAAELKNDANFETMFNVPAKKTSNSKNLFTIIALLLYVQYCKAISYLATRV
jgi:hypothetical protein